jgi:hypothetical protein
MAKHDHPAAKRIGETAGWLGIEFVAYDIVCVLGDLRGQLFHSSNADSHE